MIAKRLADLPRALQLQLAKWYFKQAGLDDPEVLFRGKDIRFAFREEHARLIRELDRRSTRMLEEKRLLQRMTKL